VAGDGAFVGPGVSSRSFDFLLVSHPRHAEFMDLVADEASSAPSNDHHGAQTAAVACADAEPTVLATLSAYGSASSSDDDDEPPQPTTQTATTAVQKADDKEGKRARLERARRQIALMRRKEDR
jgi:hypothetical protein